MRTRTWRSRPRPTSSPRRRSTGGPRSAGPARTKSRRSSSRSPGHKRWPDFHLDADEFAARVRERNPKRLGDGVRVFYEMYAEKIGKPRWGDKTPFYVRKMDVIHRVLPEARFVHLIRDGRAVALSIKDLWFGPDTIEGCAEFWVARLDEAREQARGPPLLPRDHLRGPGPRPGAEPPQDRRVHRGPVRRAHGPLLRERRRADRARDAARGGRARRPHRLDRGAHEDHGEPQAPARTRRGSTAGASR